VRAISLKVVHLACKRGYFEIVQYLLKREGSRNVSINQSDRSGMTPLHYCCHFRYDTLLVKNRMRILKLLVKNKAELNVIDRSNQTPLILACRYLYLHGSKDENKTTESHIYRVFCKASKCF